MAFFKTEKTETKYEICTDESILNLGMVKNSYIKPLVAIPSGDIAMDGIIAAYKTFDSASGNVNIGNRIFTEKGVVSILGNGIFKIAPAGTEPEMSPQQRELMKRLGSGLFEQSLSEKKPEDSVTAIIDGKEYVGSYILFEKGEVTVYQNPANQINIL